MSDVAHKRDYAVTLAELEAGSRVAAEDMVTEQAEPPPPDALAPEELDRLRLLGITGAGRLKHH